MLQDFALKLKDTEKGYHFCFPKFCFAWHNCVTCVLVRLLTYYSVFVTFDASRCYWFFDYKLRFSHIHILQNSLWPLIISASISVFLLHWIRVYQEVYAFQTRYVLFPLQLLCCSLILLRGIRSMILMLNQMCIKNFYMLNFISNNWAF